MNKNKSIIQLIEVPKISDDCLLIFAQAKNHIPFVIRRAFWIVNANPALPRGFHAHKKTKQVLFCIQGDIRIVVDDGIRREQVILNNPNVGIFFSSMVWHEMHDFKKNTVLLVVNSHPFDPHDYIRNYKLFLKLVKA